MALKNNTWKLNQWYDQDVAGNVEYSGDRQLWAMGRNHSGQLGQNSINTPSNNGLSSPVQVMGGGWIGAWSSGTHIMGTKTDGTAWAVGYNGPTGKLGTGAPAPTYVSSPVQMPGSWSSVQGSSADNGIMQAVNTDGELFMWGFNDNGELGHNNTTTINSPVQIPGAWATGYRKTAVGYSSYGIKADGTLWSWGYNYSGSMGASIPTGSKRSSPVQVGSGEDWDKLGNLYQTMWAIKTDGTLWGAGGGGYGALAQGNTTSYSSPRQVPGTTWKDISSMDDGSIAIKTDGTLWAWGRNAHGQLGQNNLTNYSSPRQVPGTTWETISTSTGSVVATKSDGTAWAWGWGIYGVLGLNTGGPAVRYSSPVQIPGTWDNTFNIGRTSLGVHFLYKHQ